MTASKTNIHCKLHRVVKCSVLLSFLFLKHRAVRLSFYLVNLWFTVNLGKNLTRLLFEFPCLCSPMHHLPFGPDSNLAPHEGAASGLYQIAGEERLECLFPSNKYFLDLFILYIVYAFCAEEQSSILSIHIWWRLMYQLLKCTVISGLKHTGKAHVLDMTWFQMALHIVKNFDKAMQK